MLNMSPIEMARQANARQGNSNAKFLTLEDGTPKVIRMITSFASTYVASHSCGLSHVDVPKEDFDACIQAGGGYPCPKCGQPLTMDDIDCERPITAGVYMHRFIQTSDPNKKGNFACIGNPYNVESGMVEGGHNCPICNSTDSKGNHPKPTFRLYGVAVEREAVIEQVNNNGIVMPVVTGVRDIYEADDNGTMKPKIVIVDLPFQSFWAKLDEVSRDGSLSECYFDWQIVRTGKGLETRYDVQRLNPTQPDTIDLSVYLDDVPDIAQMLKNQGTPKYYSERGWGIEGYVPETQQPQQQTNYQQNYQQPQTQYQTYQPQPQQVQPTQMPTMATGWSQISQALGQK